jgi:hypothetical protein
VQNAKQRKSGANPDCHQSDRSAMLAIRSICSPLARKETQWVAQVFTAYMHGLIDAQSASKNND